MTKDDQLVLSQELSKRLENDLKKQKLKTRKNENKRYH